MAKYNFNLKDSKELITTYYEKYFRRVDQWITAEGLNLEISCETREGIKEYIKPYIVNAKLLPLEVELFSNKIISVTNSDELLKVIRIMSLQEDLSNLFKNYSQTLRSNILRRLDDVRNNELISYFRLSERGPYLRYLCQRQCERYKIVPTTEVFSNSWGSNHEETFLFTICKENDNNFILWESTELNRATYVFNTSAKHYATDIQRIFDFIVSYQASKRRKLRYSLRSSENLLKSSAVIEHDNFESWAKAIGSTVRS